MKEFDFFWETVDKCDWDKQGDDDAVLAPLIEFLSELSDDDIFIFDDMMSELLYRLDTKNHALDCEKTQGIFSEDAFLYSRCVALVNGPEYYTKVLNRRIKRLWNMEFESILYVPSAAWAKKHGKDEADYPHLAPLSYETGSNEDGWK